MLPAKFVVEESEGGDLTACLYMQKCTQGGARDGSAPCKVCGTLQWVCAPAAALLSTLRYDPRVCMWMCACERARVCVCVFSLPLFVCECVCVWAACMHVCVCKCVCMHANEL